MPLRGWSLKSQARKENHIWTARRVNHDLTSWFCCYQCSTLFNCNRYSYIWAFFDLIEWLKDYFLNLCLYLIDWLSTISRFWICWLIIHHFWCKENYSRTPGSYRYTNSIELVPSFGFWPSPHAPSELVQLLYKHFKVTSVVWWKWKTQLDWVIKPVPHDLV